MPRQKKNPLSKPQRQRRSPSTESPQQSQPQSPQPEPENLTPEILESPLPPEVHEAAGPAFSGTPDSAAHLEGLAAEIGAEEPTSDETVGEVIEAPVVSRDVFRASFVGGFNFGGIFLDAMKIKPDEVERANAAADALYDTALEVHWLRFLLDPQAATVQRIIVIFSFVGPKLKACISEVRDKKKAARQIAQPQSAGPVPVPKSGPRDPEPGDGAVVSAS